MILYILILALGLQTSCAHARPHSPKHRLHSITKNLRSMATNLSHTLAMYAPSTFGKTHFIVSHPTNPVPRNLSLPITPASQPATSTTLVFFTPDDNVRDELVQLINQESEAIRIAVFVITDAEIARALLDARERGIKIELVTDAGCLKERANKINQLCDRGCSVYIYNPSYCKQTGSSIMHHKFALFSNNAGKLLVWTGSYNFTKAASSHNQENALILDDQRAFELFSNQFNRLKERSFRYTRIRNTIET